MAKTLTELHPLAAEEDFYIVESSNKGEPTLNDQGLYMLCELGTGIPALGYDYDATLDEIEEFLSDEPQAVSHFVVTTTHSDGDQHFHLLAKKGDAEERAKQIAARVGARSYTLKPA